MMLFRPAAAVVFSMMGWASAMGSEPPPWLGSATGATVLVRVQRMFRGSPVPTSGSGFFITTSGIVLTNWHVVAPQIELPSYGDTTEVATSIGKIEVVIDAGTPRARTVEGKVVTSDRRRDLALLRVAGARAPTLGLAARPATVTAPIWAIGFPFGEMLAANKDNPEPTVTLGRVTAIRHDEQGLEERIQIDAAVNPGNSGGPLLDGDGNVVGVIVAGIHNANAMSFAIPLSIVQAFVDEKQVLVKVDPDAVYRRADRIKVSISPLLLSLAGLRCTFSLTGSDIDEQGGEMGSTGGAFSAEVTVPPPVEGRPRAASYSLVLRLADAAGKNVLERKHKLAVLEEGISKVASDRDPVAMMRDRQDFANATEGGGFRPVGLSDENSEASQQATRTLGDLAKSVKLAKPEGDGPVSLTDQQLDECMSGLRKENYERLPSEELAKLARRWDLVSCRFQRAFSDALDMQGSEVSAEEYDEAQAYFNSKVGISAQAHRAMVELEGPLIEAGLCRCGNGQWSMHHSSSCAGCITPALPEFE